MNWNTRFFVALHVWVAAGVIATDNTARAVCLVMAAFFVYCVFVAKDKER